MGFLCEPFTEYPAVVSCVYDVLGSCVQFGMQAIVDETKSGGRTLHGAKAVEVGKPTETVYLDIRKPRYSVLTLPSKPVSMSLGKPSPSDIRFHVDARKEMEVPAGAVRDGPSFLLSGVLHLSSPPPHSHSTGLRILFRKAMMELQFPRVGGQGHQPHFGISLISWEGKGKSWMLASE